jgi:uncharacterized protein (DUF58 family)
MRSSRSPRSEPGWRPPLIVGTALTGAGLLFASPVLIAPGAGLLGLVLVAAVWALLGGRDSAVSRTGLPAGVVEGEPFEVRHRIRKGPLPLAGNLLDAALDGTLPVIALGPRRAVELVTEATFEGRGRRVIGAPELRIGDPLGIFERRATGEGETGLIVLPRIEEVRLAAGPGGATAGRLLGAGGDRSGGGLRNAPSDPELDGLQPYVPGSPASRIYWPGLARDGELLERRLAGAGGTAPLVALACEGAAPADADRAVRAAASICRRIALNGGCELLLPGGGRLSVDRRPGSWEEAHVALALAGSGVPRLRELDPETVLVWISASATTAPPRRMRGYIVVPTPVAGRRAAFEVAGCRAYALAVAGEAMATREAAA